MGQSALAKAGKKFRPNFEKRKVSFRTGLFHDPISPRDQAIDRTGHVPGSELRRVESPYGAETGLLQFRTVIGDAFVLHRTEMLASAQDDWRVTRRLQKPDHARGFQHPMRDPIQLNLIREIAPRLAAEYVAETVIGKRRIQRVAAVEIHEFIQSGSFRSERGCSMVEFRKIDPGNPAAIGPGQIAGRAANSGAEIQHMALRRKLEVSRQKSAFRSMQRCHKNHRVR